MTATRDIPPLGSLCGLKVDVDTRRGMALGVPRVLDTFAEFGVRATFFLSFGPDTSGHAIRNVLRRPGFLRKMLRTRAHRLYGWRTMVSGTLLPARLIAADFPETVRRIDAEGHEVAVHAWDHRLWQDRLDRLSRDEIVEQFSLAFDCFEKILGRRPRAVAAPAWFATPVSLTVQDGLGLTYASDMRGPAPCRVEWSGHIFETMQIPTTQPCLEELVSQGKRDADANLDAVLRHGGRAPMVVPLHAEVEGGVHMPFLRAMLARLRNAPLSVRTLGEIAAAVRASRQALPTMQGTLAPLPGRSGRVFTYATSHVHTGFGS